MVPSLSQWWCENSGVSTRKRWPSRRSDTLFAIPRGETLKTFPSYPDAHVRIRALVTHGVEPSSLSIVGSDVAVVEQVHSKVGHGRAALSSAMSGSWLGLLAGLVVVVVDPTDFATPILSGVLIGAGIGMVVGIALFSFGRGNQRRYRSSQHVVAAAYRVVVDPAESDSAHKAIKEHAEHGGD